MTNAADDDAIDPQTLRDWQNRFEAALPRIERYARVTFRDYKPDKQEEAVAATVAVAWKFYVGLCRKGKNPDRFISHLAGYAARQVRDGRHVTGQEKAKDVLSPRAQRRKGFYVQSLPAHDSSDQPNDALAALADTRRASPADQAAFRSDTREWLGRLGAVKRPIVEGMMQGDTTTELAARFKKSPGRISQIRQEAYADYRRFHGEDTDAGPGR